MKNIIEAIDAKLQSLKDEIYFKDLQIEALKRELEQGKRGENDGAEKGACE